MYRHATNLIKLSTLAVSFILSPLVFANTTAANKSLTEQSKQKPLWEVGLIGGVFNSPTYPSSTQNKTNAIAAPFVIYRGEIFRIGDGSAARAIAFKRDWLELDISLDGAFNSKADDNTARQGMPELDYMFEVGPKLRANLSKLGWTTDKKARLVADLQARAVFSTDLSSINHRGYVFNPKVSYRYKWSKNIATSFTVSPHWGTERLHDYFYQVAAPYQTDTRPLFDAKPGYLGTEVGLSLSYNPRKNVQLFFATRANLNAGAKNADSPLFGENNNFSFGFGFNWRLWQSKTMATN